MEYKILFTCLKKAIRLVKTFIEYYAHYAVNLSVVNRSTSTISQSTDRIDAHVCMLYWSEQVIRNCSFLLPNTRPTCIHIL